MNYNIKGTGLPLSEELRSYVTKRLSRAEKFDSDGAAHADVELEFDELHDGEGKYRAEFNVFLRGQMHRAEAWGASLHEAIDRASDELADELRRSSKKRLQVFRRTAVKVKEFLRGWRRDV